MKEGLMFAGILLSRNPTLGKCKDCEKTESGFLFHKGIRELLKNVMLGIRDL